MKLILDTANLAEIRYFNDYFPIVGVTTNPTILSKEGGDVLKLLKEIRAIIGEEKELHVQVTELTYENILKEARAIVRFLGTKENTFVKIPVSPDGLHAIATLSAEGYRITATAILTATQAMLASNAGAAYVAPYVSRCENLTGDGIGLVSDIAVIFAASGTATEILAASFKTAKQVLDVAVAGGQASTVGPDVMRKLLAHPTTDSSIAGFDADFKGAFGGTLLSKLEK